MSRFFRQLQRLRRDDRGVFAVIFGLMAIVLVALGGAVVDYVSLEQTRSRAQTALDAAALALQPRIYDQTEAQLGALAEALLVERIGVDSIDAEVVEVIKDEDLGTLYLEATMVMPTIFVSLVGVTELPARIHSEAVQGVSDLEVAVALDLSNSMNSAISDGRGGTTTKIASLKTALNQMIELLVRDDQASTYSKMALVPYSQAVNAGTYANTVRGPITAPAAITSIAWSSGTAKTITGLSRASPAVITSVNHGFANGDTVYIAADANALLNGVAQLNNRIFTVANRSANTFQLQGTNSTVFPVFLTAAGTVTKCLVATCELVVATSAPHGLSQNQYAYISGVGGMNSYTSQVNVSFESFNQDATQGRNSNNTARADDLAYNWINNNPSDTDYKFLAWQVGATAANTFVLPGTARTNGKNYGTYTSGGTVACVVEGCPYFLFTNTESSTTVYGRNAGNTSKRRHAISTCVTERTPNTFTDASYLTTLLGRNYAASNNPCLSATVLPLTATKGTNATSNTNRTTLHGVANTLTASGSTGGQIGVAWAWYLLSQRFGGPWPSSSQPAAATAVPPVQKALVIMTDGEYNSIYRRGVIAQNSTAGSGDTRSMIGENAGNGSSYEQTAQLCTAIKAAGITIYTVGLAIDDKPEAQSLMRDCASDSSKAYQAGSGQALQNVFADIAGQLSNLRLSQ